MSCKKCNAEFNYLLGKIKKLSCCINNAEDGVGVPSGGATNQVLVKKSDDDFDTEWADAGGGVDINGFSFIDGNKELIHTQSEVSFRDDNGVGATLNSDKLVFDDNVDEIELQKPTNSGVIATQEWVSTFVPPTEIGSVSPSDTAPTTDGIYRAKEAGDYDNLEVGLVAQEGYITWFKLDTGVWSLYNEVKVEGGDDSVIINKLEFALNDLLEKEVRIDTSKDANWEGSRYFNRSGVKSVAIPLFSCIEINIEDSNTIYWRSKNLSFDNAGDYGLMGFVLGVREDNSVDLLIDSQYPVDESVTELTLDVTMYKSLKINYYTSVIGFKDIVEITKVVDEVTTIQDYVSLSNLDLGYKTAKYDLSWRNFLGKNVIDINACFTTGTQQQRIQQAFDFAEGKSFTLVLGKDTINDTNTWNIDSSLLIGDDTALIISDGITIKFSADEVVDNIIRNKGIETIPSAVLHSDDYMTGELRVSPNKNIIILGSGIGKSFIEGSDIPYSAPRPNNPSLTQNWVGDEYGWRTISVYLANVTCVEVGGFSLSKGKGWSNVLELCEEFYVHDIDINSIGVINGDGVDIITGSKKGLVKNIQGTMFDDMVFVGNYSRSSMVYPDTKYIYPMNATYNDLNDNPISFQDVYNVDVVNVSGNSWSAPIRIGGSGGCKIHDISVNGLKHLRGEYANSWCVLSIEGTYNSGAASVGDIYNIFANNISGYHGSGSTIHIDSMIRDSWINDVKSYNGMPIGTSPDASVLITNAI